MTSFNEHFGIHNEAGWKGAFTRQQAEGAIPNGTRIVKANSEPTDPTANGTPGTILGSLSHPEVHDGVIFYFVEWSNRPRTAVGVLETKVERPSYP